MSDEVLREVHSMVSDFLTPEVRAKLNLPLPDSDALRASTLAATQREQLLEENTRLRNELIDALGPAEKRKRIVNEGPCVSTWERRRGQEELENSKVAYDRDRALRQQELQALERERDEQCRNVKFLHLRIEDKERGHAKALAAAQQEVNNLRGEIRAAREEHYKSSGEGVREVHDNEMQRRKIEHLLQENAALEANLSKERSEFDQKITEIRGLHKRALRQAEQQLEDQKEAYARSQHLITDSAPSGARNAEAEGLRREIEDLRRQVKAVHYTGAAGGGSSTAQPRRSQTEPDEVYALRLRLEASQNELQAAATVVAERDQLLDQAKSWEGLFSAELVPRGGLHEGVKELKSALPVKVYKALAQARAEELRLKELYGRCDARRRELEAKVDELGHSLQAERSTHEKDKNQLRLLKDDLAVKENMIEVRDRAIQRRQDLLSTYDSNEQKPGRLSDDQRLAKETLLQQEVEAKDHEISELRVKQAFVVSKETYAAVEAKNSKLDEELRQEAVRSSKLERTLERVESELAAFKAAMSSGEVTASTSKIIHMPNNPAAEAARERRIKVQQRLEELEEENADLKRRMQSLGTGSEASDSSSRTGAEAAQENIVNQRMKEMFKKNVDQFKQVVQSLFGYEVSFRPGVKSDYRVRLRSTYAGREDDVLEFAWVDTKNDGKIDVASPLQLMSTEFALHLQRDRPSIMKTYLENFDSIPMFLGGVTHYLFENTTQHINFKG